MVCGLCGSRYVGGRVTDGKGWSKHYYRCGAQVHQGKGCKGAAIPADFIETYIWDQCREFVRNPGEVINLLQAKIAEQLNSTKDTAERQYALQQTLLAKGQARERIKQIFMYGHITPEEMDASYKAIDREISVIRMEIDALRSQASVDAAYAQYYENTTTLLESLRDRVEKADDTLRQYVISKLVSRIEVNTVFEPEKKASFACTFHFKTEHVGLDSCSGQTARECTDGPPGHRAIPYPWP
jgi:site-specific DNA recombinase